MTFGRGKPSEARRGWATRDAYKAAYALEQTYKIAGNLGDVAVTLGKHREGAEYLSHALRTMPDDKAALKKQVQARLEQAKKEIGTLSITVNVEGANVSCDGRDVGKAPIEGEVFVEAGATSVVVRAEGHKEARRTVALAKGETKALEITLETDPNAGAWCPWDRAVAPVALAALRVLSPAMVRVAARVTALLRTPMAASIRVG